MTSTFDYRPNAEARTKKRDLKAIENWICGQGQGWEKSIVIHIRYRYSLFLFIEYIGAFAFLNEYRIWPCPYFISA